MLKRREKGDEDNWEEGERKRKRIGQLAIRRGREKKRTRRWWKQGK